MKEEIRQNLEFEANVMADMTNSTLEAEEVNKLSEGTCRVAKTLSEVEQIDNRTRLDEEEAKRAEELHKLEKINLGVDIGCKLGKLALGIAALIFYRKLGMDVKDKELNEYVVDPKSKSTATNGLKDFLKVLI